MGRAIWSGTKAEETRVRARIGLGVRSVHYRRLHRGHQPEDIYTISTSKYLNTREARHDYQSQTGPCWLKEDGEIAIPVDTDASS